MELLYIFVINSVEDINVIQCLVSRSDRRSKHTDVRVTDLYTMYIIQIFFLI